MCVSRYLLQPITLYLTQHNKTENCYTLVIGNIQSITSQAFGVVGPLGEKLDFLVPWDLTFKDIMIMKSQKPSPTQSEP